MTHPIAAQMADVTREGCVASNGDGHVGNALHELRLKGANCWKEARERERGKATRLECSSVCVCVWQLMISRVHWQCIHRTLYPRYTQSLPLLAAPAKKSVIYRF